MSTLSPSSLLHLVNRCPHSHHQSPPPSSQPDTSFTDGSLQVWETCLWPQGPLDVRNHWVFIWNRRCYLSQFKELRSKGLFFT